MLSVLESLGDVWPWPIQTESGSFKAKLKLVENMASGVLIIPRHRKLAWQIFQPGIKSIGRDQIKKAQD